MISSIHSNNDFIVVEGATSSYPYISPGANGAGIIRWNSTMNCFEVNDGAVWQKIYNNNVQISLSNHASEILQWVENKMQREKQLKNLAATHPGIKSLLDQADHIHEQIEIMQTLITQNNAGKKI